MTDVISELSNAELAMYFTGIPSYSAAMTISVSEPSYPITLQDFPSSETRYIIPSVGALGALTELQLKSTRHMMMDNVTVNKNREIFIYCPLSSKYDLSTFYHKSLVKSILNHKYLIKLMISAVVYFQILIYR